MRIFNFIGGGGINWTKTRKQIVKLSKPLAIDIGYVTSNYDKTKQIFFEFRIFGYGLDFDAIIDGDKRLLNDSKFELHSFYLPYTSKFWSDKF